MEHTIYSRYSNERAARFAVRTDIVADESGNRHVCKYAWVPEGEAHIAQIAESYRKLTEAYADADPVIRFCPCLPAGSETGGNTTKSCAAFPFVQGVALQELLERAAAAGDREQIRAILAEYIRRVGAGGGEQPFRVTGKFREVFGDRAPAEGESCALVGDIDLIFSNILLPGRSDWDADADWEVIDYEWTFDFPIPKEFILYRAFYFAYYQVLGTFGWSLQELYAAAGIGEAAVSVYARMEEHFQEYIRMGALPVRNMQRAMGTKVIPLAELLRGNGADGGAGSIVPESEWIKVRRIQYHIDREERQDGSVIVSGWALARTWDGRALPVDIRVTGEAHTQIPAEISRRERRDVAQALKIRGVTSPLWGFDCVWPGGEPGRATVHFSLGRSEKSREICL